MTYVSTVTDRSSVITHRDGIHFDVGTLVVVDARNTAGDVNVVSHAHADHTFRSAPETVLCSAETAAIAAARTGTGFEFVESVPGIELVPAGHVVGSRAALVEGDDGTRYCYTGDFSTRDRLYLDGFDPGSVDADVLVMETTYGHPRYRFPPQDELAGAVVDWIADNGDRPLFLFGYSLGRAQKLQHLVAKAIGTTADAGVAGDDRCGDREILVSETIRDVNHAIEAATDIVFPARAYTTDELTSLTNEIVIVPSNQSRADWLQRAVDHSDALKGGFSGWAVDDSFLYRGDYDETFALTDHCDFSELVETVRTIDPDVVYTHHGFDETFADAIETEYGYRARPLKRDQRRLEEFC